MNVKNPNSTRYEFFITGPISEKNDIFDYPIKNLTEIIVDMEKMTFINSIGVKNWINWSSKISVACKMELVKCPFVVINQVNIVHGFLPKHARIQSFYAPYYCECGAELNLLSQRGKEYEYSQNGEPEKINFPEEIPCKKCSGKLTPDFLPEKISKFLKLN